MSTAAVHSAAETIAAVKETKSVEPLNVLVIMGATGAGKSRLSIDMATRFPPAEIINSDKIQVYKGLDITTNKIALSEQAGVPHHLLGTFESHVIGDLSPERFRVHASELIAQISARSSLPILVGGSNSFVHALLTDQFDPKHDPFSSSVDDDADAEDKDATEYDEGAGLTGSSLRYRCCFLWVDVSLPVLYEYLGKRVDEMIKSGMVEEIAKHYHSGKFDASPPGIGLNKAIGVPEFANYFRSLGIGDDEDSNKKERKSLYDASVRQIKENTCRLAKRQLEKIQRLRRLGWEVKRVDATEAFKKALEDSAGEFKGNDDDGLSVWKKKVVEPSAVFVKRFLQEQRVRK